MITCYTLKDENIKEIKWDQVRRDSITWVRVQNPEIDELDKVSKRYKVPPEDLKEFLKEDERPVLVNESGYLYIVFSTPYQEPDGDITTSEICFIIKENNIVTIEKVKYAAVEKVKTLVEHRKGRFLFNKSIGYFLDYFIDRINDNFIKTINRIGHEADIIKDKKSFSFSTKSLDRVFDSNITLTHFNQALLANIEVLNTLRKTYYKTFTKRDKELFADLYYDALQILDTEKIQREIITNMFNFHSALSSHSLNVFMKRLTSLALIIMIPTLISGIYGMNFKVIPFSQNPYGFVLTCVFMVLISILGLIIFRKIDWI